MTEGVGDMEVTDELIDLFGEVWDKNPHVFPHDRRRKALRAVFAEVDRRIEETHEPWCQGCNAPHQIKGDE